MISEGPAINPGTVNAHLPEAFGKGPLHASHHPDQNILVIPLQGPSQLEIQLAK